KLVPGVQPQLIESSCCGMAGSFGYEASHMAVSNAMAEQSLFPALRENAAATRFTTVSAARQFTRRCCSLPPSPLDAQLIAGSAQKDGSGSFAQRGSR